jgi:tetratricopeptide (TPR) repeat protein
LENAREHLATAIRLARETGDAEKAATWLMNLGNISRMRGKLAEGVTRYEEALGEAQANGFARLEAQVRYNLGSTLAQQGQLQTARAHLRTSSVLLRKIEIAIGGRGGSPC